MKAKTPTSEAASLPEEPLMSQVVSDRLPAAPPPCETWT